MKRTLVYVALAAVLLVALGLWIRHVGRGSSVGGYGGAIGPDSDTAVARGIRLMGVQPAGADDLLDANGRKIGEVFSLLDDRYRWTRGHRNLHRCFVLELPKTAGDILLHGHFSVRSSVEGRMLGGSIGARQVKHRGKRLLIYDVRMPADFRESGLLSNYAVPVERVDLTVRFYHGPPGDCQVSFSAPFAPGPTVTTQDGHTCTLTIKQQGAKLSPDFTISANRRLDMSAPVLLYDKDGKRHKAERRGYSSGGRRTTMTCNLGKLSWDRAAKIVVGEEPQRRTFRNLLVCYPDRPDRRYGEHVYRMAKALGRSADQVARNGPANTSEAVKVMHLARGNQVRRVCDMLLALKLAELPAEKLAAVRETATSWIESPSPTARLCGIKLGMKAGGEKFVAAALQLLESEEPTIRSQAAYAIRRYGKKLSDPDFRRITRMLLAKDDRYVVSGLLRCLASINTPATTEALRELLAAEEDRPWLWWRAAEALKSRKPAGDRASLPKRLRLRLILANGAQKGEEALAAEAHRMLPALLTPKCSRVDSTTFWRIREKLLKHADRPAATKAMVDFLRGVSTRLHNTSHFGQIVKQLNLWYAVNLGALGWDVDGSSPDEPRKDWPAIIDEVVGWYEAGGPDRAAPTATATSRSTAQASCRFGPAREETIRARRGGDPSYIDLDTCKLLAGPSDVDTHSYKARRAWCRENGIDGRLSVHSSGASLAGYDLTISPIPDAWWQSITPQRMRQALATASKDSRHVTLKTDEVRRAIFCFETRDGGRGLLRIVEIDPSAGTVTLRRKLLRPPGSEGAE